MRIIWRLMVPPDSAFHCQTRCSNSSRPRSRRSDAFFGEFAFDHHLGGDAGVVGAGEPEGVFAAHAVPADGDVDLGVLEHVAHVEDAGDVGRRDDEREDLGARLGDGAKEVGSIHHCAQWGSKPLRLIDFL